MKKDERTFSSAYPQVKVCGLTLVEEAVACAQLGVDAVGLIFYPPSPRFVSERTALEISANLPEKVWKIGVFVNGPFLEIMKRVEFCRLNCVQLHGTEPPEMVEALESAGICVIKSFFCEKGAVFLRSDPLPGIGLPGGERRRVCSGRVRAELEMGRCKAVDG